MPIFGSLFTGVGGFDLGLERAGWTCAFQCEIDPFCQRVLERHWPDVPRTDDIRVALREKRAGETGTDQPAAQGAEREDGQGRFGPIDLLVGGFPCQDLSVAGKRAGLAGERSGLFWEFLRVARELSPEWLLLENVPGLLSSRGGRDFGTLLKGLEDSGYGWAYRILDSQHFGVAQRRRRVFIVGHRGGPVPPAVIFEPASRTGHPAPGRQAGARVAASLTSGAHGAGVSAPGRRKEDDVNLVASCLQERYGKGTDSDATDTMIVGALQHLGNGGPNDNEAQAGHLIAGSLHNGIPGRDASDAADGKIILAHTLKAEGADASEDGTGRGVPMIPIQYVEQWGRDKRQNGIGLGQPDDPSFTPDASYPHGFVAGSSVRRLTPTECERLQGFPDGWTCLCGVEPYSTMTCRCPDSARYRAMGNAVTVPVIEWLGQRLARAAAQGVTHGS